MDPKNKCALVTGGSRGIGAATCLALARAGVHVAVNYNKSPELAHQVVKNCRNEGVNAVALQADVSKLADIHSLVDETVNALGGLDILINNAGINKPGEIATLSEADWDEVVDTSIKSTFFCTQAALPYLKQSGSGRVVNLSSLAGKRGTGLPHYAAAKAGVMGLTMSLALQLAPHGITVNSIYPGLVATDFGPGPEKIRQAGKAPGAVPLGRAGEPEEAAETIMFLVRSDYITGEHINFTGGRYMAL